MVIKSSLSYITNFLTPCSSIPHSYIVLSETVSKKKHSKIYSHSPVSVFFLFSKTSLPPSHPTPSTWIMAAASPGSAFSSCSTLGNAVPTAVATEAMINVQAAKVRQVPKSLASSFWANFLVFWGTNKFVVGCFCSKKLRKMFVLLGLKNKLW